LISLLSSGLTLAAYNFLGLNNRDVVFSESGTNPISRLVSMPGGATTAGAPGDFSYAAELASPTVVHIRTTMTVPFASSKYRIFSFS